MPQRRTALFALLDPRSPSAPRRKNRMGAAAIAALGLLLALVASGVTVPGPAAAASAKTAAKGKIYVIHGITGQTLDIYVDGKKVLPDAKPKTVVGPLTLDAGTHAVTLEKSGKTVATGKFTLGAGQTDDIVAHLRSDSATGSTVSAFRDDLAAVGPGKLRLAVAHVAAAPPADIKVNGDVLFSNVASGDTLTVVVPSGTYKVEIVPAATSGNAILGPVSLPLKKGTLTRVYAIGNVSTGSMDAIVHTLPVKVSGAAAPSSVPTGDGGQAATQFVANGSRVTELMVASAFVLLLVAGAIGVTGRRMRRRALV
jgi:hypothetical protein